MIQMKKTKKGQAGFVVTAELLLITVILVLGLVTGMTKLRDQSIAELSDTGDAIGAINQSYSILGTVWGDGTNEVASTTGFAFADAFDPAAAPGGSVGGDGQLVLYRAAPTASQSGNAFESPVFTY